MSRGYTHYALLLDWTLAGHGETLGQYRTVPGPEVKTLLPSAASYVLLDRPRGGISALRLPTLKETVVRSVRSPNSKDMPTIHALSGPDAEGWIAYIEDHFFVAKEKDQRHLLKAIKLDGTQDTELFSRPGHAMWAKSPAGHGEIGEHLALAPVQGRVAFLSELSPVQMPAVLVYVGTVEIWDMHKKAGVKTNIRAIDEGLAWFPDGKRLAYVKFVDPKTVALEFEGNSFGKAFQRWDKVPAVFVRDVGTGTDSFLHLGWRPVVSFDGRSVLVADLQTAWQRVDVVTGKSDNVTWRGAAWKGAVAYLSENVVLSWCLPTEGTKIKYTDHNSSLRGPKQMLTLKLAKLNGEEFQTVVPYIDPRAEVSFGQVRQNEEERPDRER